MAETSQKRPRSSRSNRTASAPRSSRTASETRVSQPISTPAPISSDEIDLVELLYQLVNSWALILCLALVGAVLAGAYTMYFVTPLYQATSVIYIVSRETAINLSDLQLGSALTQDYIKVFDMWEVNAEVIDKLGLPYSNTEIRRMVTVRNSANTHMLDITATSPSPQEAADIANEYASVTSQFIADTMSTERPNIMSVALPPAAPSSPNIMRNIAMGFILGAMLAVGIATVRMLLDDKYKTAEAIRRYTGLTTLAVIPLNEAMPDRRNPSRQGGDA